MAGDVDDFSNTTYLEDAYDMGVNGVQALDRSLDHFAGLSKYGLTEAMVWAVIIITLIVSSRALTRPMIDQGVRERRQKADREDHVFRKQHGLYPYHGEGNVTEAMKMSDDLPAGYGEG